MKGMRAGKTVPYPAWAGTESEMSSSHATILVEAGVRDPLVTVESLHDLPVLCLGNGKEGTPTHMVLGFS